MNPTTTKVVDIDELRESPFNPRRNYGNLAELAATMKDGAGIRQPPLARPTKNGLELVYGHRRVRAAKLAGIKRITVQVREMTDSEAMEEQIIENSQREDIHPMDSAESYGRLAASYGGYGKKFAERLAERVGKSRAHVYAHLKLLDLAEPAREAFRKNPRLSVDGMLEVARMQNERLQLRVLERYERGGPGGNALSIRKLQRWVRDAFKPSKPSRESEQAPKEKHQLRQRTAALVLSRAVAAIERERAYENFQVKMMALGLLDRGVSDELLRRREYPSAEALRKAVEQKLSPAQLRGVAFELAIEHWAKFDGDEYSDEVKVLAKAFGHNLKELEELAAALKT